MYDTKCRFGKITIIFNLHHIFLQNIPHRIKGKNYIYQSIARLQ